ncbi:MAG: hypothetical protein NUV97_01380 [archaeon]|nr:hypothetical protein [archaeon]
METSLNPTLILTPIIRGTDKDLKFNIYDSLQNLTPEVLTGFKVEFYLLKTVDGVALITKKNTAAGGGDTQVTLSSNLVTVKLLNTDSTSFAVFSYIGVLKITTTDNPVKIFKIYMNVPFI